MILTAHLGSVSAVPLIDRTDSVLVIVDFQPAFMTQNSMTEAEKTEARAARARALWLSAAASLLAVPAVVVEEGPERAGKTDPALIERLPPDTAVRVRRTFGIASQTKAIADLTAIGRRTCVLLGFETDTCVGQSAIELLDIGYRVVAVEDAMYSAGVTEHHRGLRRMRAAGTEINDCKGVFFEWTQVVDDALAAIRTLTAKYGPPPLRL
jgi:nicotinamidase-related amidase